MQPENNLNPQTPQRLRTLEPVYPPKTVPQSGTTKPPVVPPSAPAAPVSMPPIVNQPSYPQPPPPPRRSQRLGGWRSSVSTLLLFLLAPAIALFIAAFVVQSYQVDGQSMEPTLQDNDRLIVNKWPRSWSRITKNTYLPARYDVIIFNHEGANFSGVSKQLIKRVIGLPGERVVVANGNLTVYNAEHPDGFNPDASGTYQLSTAVTPGSIDVTLQSDEIFVCGDNRANSEDSRFFGPVDAGQVVGKLAFRIVPIDKIQRF